LQANRERIMNKVLAAWWGIRLAWKIDKKMFLFWTVLSVGLAVLPAVALYYNRDIIANISEYIATGNGSFASVTRDIVILGLILTAIGLSSRLNDDFLYMRMYDSYYLGLQEVMMDSAQRIDLTEFVRKKIRDEFYAAISRCGALTDLMSSGCVLVARLASMISLLAVAFTVSGWIFIATIVYVAAVFYLNVVFSDRVRVVWSETREKLRRANYFEKLPQDGDTAKEMRIFDCMEQVKKHWENAYREIEKTDIRRARGIAQLTFFSRLGFYLFMVFVILYSLVQLAAGRLGPDVLLMVYTLCLNIADVVSSVPKSYQQMDYGLYGLDLQRRFFETMAKEDSGAEQHKAHEPLDEEICFEADIRSFKYNDEKPVLQNINLKIRRGETVALVGSNGSGKTTLIKLLLGLYRPTDGEVKFMGRRHDEYRKNWVAEKVGVFFQDFYLFHLTLGENVGIGNLKEVNDERKILDAMERGGAIKLLGKLKKGLGQLLGRQVDKDGAMLSGGEQQRVAVSRTHMSDKEVLIFDEPASMLDPIAEMEQFFNIKKKLAGRTAILVSHRIGFARLADRILVLDGGRLVEDGTHDELIAKGGVYAELFQKQAHWYDTSFGDVAATNHGYSRITG